MFIKFLKLLVKVKFDFSTLEHKKVILFDCENTLFLEKLFRKNDYFILSTRYNNFKKIFVNISLLKYFILNYDKNLSLKQNYLLSIIFLINPKLLVTYTDISTDFYRLSKFMYKKLSAYLFKEELVVIYFITQTKSEKTYLSLFYFHLESTNKKSFV